MASQKKPWPNTLGQGSIIRSGSKRSGHAGRFLKGLRADNYASDQRNMGE